MKKYCKIALIFCLAFLFCCLPLTAQCQYGFPYNTYGGNWQPQYNMPYPYFPNRIQPNPFMAYNPYQNQMAFMNPSQGWQLPYFQQNTRYQTGPFVNLNPYLSSYLPNTGNNFYNSSYNEGPSTYFHLLPNYMLNDPYTLAQQAQRARNED